MFVPPPMMARGVRMEFEEPVVMGILNLTPDSFSDGGQLKDEHALLARTAELIDAGAAIIDVGGESTRPGALPIDAQTEIHRTIPAVRQIGRDFPNIVISIDTSKAAVARAALAAGAHIVNDVSALRDPKMASVVAEAGAGLIVMHMKGEPRTMQQGEIVYDDVLSEVALALQQARDKAYKAGVSSNNVAVDPGIGFGKTLAHNIELTQRLGELSRLGCPVCYGPSRKRFLGDITGRTVDQRDAATAAACVAAILAGAHMIRVHAPSACRDAVKVATALRHRPQG